MKKIRSLLVIFENDITPQLIPAFRGAIVSRVGRDNPAFHNHNKDKLIYKYPIIQYKALYKKASLYCIGEGVDEIHNFFGLRNWDIQLHEKKVELKIDKLELNTINLNVWDKLFQYSIRDWAGIEWRKL